MHIHTQVVEIVFWQTLKKSSNLDDHLPRID